MPHTTTKNARTKRTDTRPNAKRRKKLQQAADKEKLIQELRVTSKQKGERAEREVVVDAMPLRSTSLDSTEKVLRALRKKLKAIEELMKRQARGDVLDDAQIAKIDAMESIIEEITLISIKKVATAAAPGGERRRQEKRRRDDDDR